MLEAAGNYIRASQILWHQPNMGKVAIVNSAIGIEIMLKSFIASPVENHRKNTVGEQYVLKKKFTAYSTCINLLTRALQENYD
jgi:hypothetical protein